MYDNLHMSRLQFFIPNSEVLTSKNFFSQKAFEIEYGFNKF